MKPNYGIDAPRVVATLFLLSLLLGIGAVLSFSIQTPLWFWLTFLYTISIALTLFTMACWMLYGMKVAKPRIALQMIQRLALQGHEKVLDLGCGRGLLLCKVAQYLPQGQAYGIDLWSSKDQSGNTIARTFENAEREGVHERIVIETGDVCLLPFPDQTFDAVVSSLCLHNLPTKLHREKALLEMLRVLKPGGAFLIADIQRSKEYADFLTAHGVSVVASKPIYAYCPPICILEGKSLS